MRRIRTAVLGVALVATAIGIGMRSFVVTDAAALVTGGVLEQTAAAAVAMRFPSNQEMFRSVAGMPQGLLIAPNPKADRTFSTLYPCGGNVVFAPHDCFASQARPKAVVAAPSQTPAVVAPQREAAVAPPRTPLATPPRETVERRPAASTSELVRAPVNATVTPVAARIAPVTPPESCKQNLPAATARMERILSQLKTTRARPDAEVCASHRASFFELVQVRDVTALCKTGGDRNVELTRIDSAVDTINAAIAQSCDSI